MNAPLVSVVLVVCNVERFLKESIESVLKQTFSNFEFIIVDFGSTDTSKVIASTYAQRDSRIRVHEIPRCGLAEARNTVCSLAQGKYIAVMDADDVSLPNRLVWEVNFMEEHSEVGLLGGATEWINAEGRGWGIHQCPTEDHEIKSALGSYHPFFHPTILIRKSVFDLVGGYRTPFAPAEDYDLSVRMSEHCKCANLKQAVLQYRIHPHQVSLQKRRQQTFGKLAAQASALSRRNGNPDPFNSVTEITPAVLSRLGVSCAIQEREVALDRYLWIQNMRAVGEYSLALNAATEMLESNLEHVERWLIAELRLLAARLYWAQHRYARSCLTAARAFITRPVMIGRPFKPVLRRLHFHSRRQPAS